MPHNNAAESTESTNSHYLSELPSPPFKFTLEIPLFLLMVGISLSGAVINNMLLFRTCVHSLNYTVKQCSLLDDPGDKTNETKSIEEETQKYTSIVTMVRSIIEAVCPAVLSLFLGVWSDTYGRKPLVVWPLLGLSFTSMLVVGYSLLKNLGPWWYIMTAIPVSLSGGLPALFTGSFSYISDISSNDTRSFRLSLLEAAVFLGTILGSLSSSYIVLWAGSDILLLIHAAVYVAAYAFTNVYVAESLRGALKGGLCTVLDLLLVKEMMTTCFKRRPNKLRAIILLIVFANSLSIFIFYGLYNLDYLYTRQKLTWDLKDYTIFSASNTMIMVAGLFVGVIFVQKVCRVSDILLTIISYLSSLAEVVVKAVAVSSWHMYLGASISMFKGLAAPLSKSLLTKILPLEDIAKVFALTCALEAILPVFSPLVFNTLYAHSLTIYPGAIYVLSGVIYGGCFIMLGFVQYYMWIYPSSPYASLNS